MSQVDRLPGISRRQFLTLAGAIPVAAVLAACESSESAWARQEAALKKAGISEDHKLLRLSSVRGLDFTADGGFLNFQAKGNETSSVQFAWQTNTADPIAVITEVPFQKAIFRLREDSGTPVVTFSFNRDRFLSHPASRFPVFFDNPNDYLENDHLGFAQFTLSEGEFLKLPPK